LRRNETIRGRFGQGIAAAQRVTVAGASRAGFAAEFGKSSQS